jgi:ELWxxDGT repeat protein
MNGSAYFLAASTPYDWELWKSDGTASGTVPVKFINPTSSSMPCFLTVWKDHLYFAATTADGTEPWISDGTEAGTMQLRDIYPGPGSSAPRAFTEFNGRLYFSATDPDHGQELWSTDGTVAGTKLVSDVLQGSESSRATPHGVANNRLILDAWVRSPLEVGSYDNELFALDGAGTLTAIDDHRFEAASQVLVNGNYAYFACNDGSQSQPCVTDGTTAGTRILRSVTSQGSSGLAWFDSFNGLTLIAVTKFDGGIDIWKTDGTEAGTVVSWSIPNAQPFDIPTLYPTTSRQRATAGQSFFLTQKEVLTGVELYALSNDSPAAASDSATASNGAAVSIDVLANDSDPDGTINRSTLKVVAAPGHGTVVRNADASLLYTPASGFSGTDTFSYTVDDMQGATSNVATVTVAVTAAPAPAAPSPTGSTSTPKGHGGGGSMTYTELAALIALLISTQRMRHRSLHRRRLSNGRVVRKRL